MYQVLIRDKNMGTVLKDLIGDVNIYEKVNTRTKK